LLFGAAVSITGWIAGSVGLTIQPFVVLIASVAATAGAGWWMVRVSTRVSWSGARLAGVIAGVAGFTIYFFRLTWAALLPISEGPDLVHHLTLIHFIQLRHALPHDGPLGAYLGEMTGYTPGSHLLAALVADWLRADGLRVLYPLTAFAVAVKAGIVYNVL